MSISIDDLASSFSASHVSQEAMDIATLQVFLTPLRSRIHANQSLRPNSQK